MVAPQGGEHSVRDPELLAAIAPDDDRVDEGSRSAGESQTADQDADFALGAALDLAARGPLEPAVEGSLDMQRLQVWLRVLRLSRQVGTELRDRLRIEFESTPPQFAVLAALYRVERGLKMTELSGALMVSNGNVTGIVERLVEQGLVARAPFKGDRRATLVRLTPRGQTVFRQMAAAHRRWVGCALDGLNEQDAQALAVLLDRARAPRKAAAANASAAG